MKRILSIVLSVIMALTVVPLSAFAQSTKNAEENGQMTTETTATGNNSVGTYLAETFQEAQAERQANASDLAGMSYLSFDGNTATVEFATQVDAQLVVAIYSEDGIKMLASGIKDVTTEDRKVTVDIASTTLPEYYLVKAFLLDKNNHSALCGEFIDDTHTKAYQDFEELDIYDFDADKIINLDSNPDNNFLVVADGAFEIFGNESTNTLTSADYDTGIYEFDNIADDIKSLKVGDIFYYQSDDKYEVIKVKSIDINGSKATIIADSMDVEEAFEAIKINSSEFEDDTATFSRSARAASTDKTVEEEFVNGTFTVKLGENEKGEIRPIISKDFVVGEEEHPESDEEKDYNDSDFKFVAEATGSAKMTANLVVYIKGDYKKVEFTVTGSIGIEVRVGVEFDKEILLAAPFFTFYKIVTIGVEIKFHFKFNVILTISGTIEFVKGFKWTSATQKFTDAGEPCEFKPEVKIEGEIYIGLILEPYVSIISENVVYVYFPIEVGANVKAVLSTDVAGDKNHNCNACLDGDIDVKLEAQAKVHIARKIDWLEKVYSSPKFSVTWHIWDFYYSITNSEFGWGKCPYSKNITDSGKCGENMNWSIDEEDGILYITGSGYMTDYNSEASPWSEYKNIKTVYIDKDVLSIGDNAFEKCSIIATVYFYGTETQWKQVTIGKNNKYLTEALIQCLDDSDRNVVDSEKCGDNLTWTFYNDGELRITGTGAMYDYDYNNRPWESYEDEIKSVVIGNSVTTIGIYAFYSCDSLESVTIPDSVTTIGYEAFAWCDSLASVTIGDSVTTIGENAFYYCHSLESVTIPDSVTTIGDFAFSDCDSLESVTIPDSVTTIGYSAFSSCNSLASVTIPDSVTTIGNYAFFGCDSLTSITVDADNTAYSSDEYGVLFNKDKTQLIQYPIGNKRTNYTIPDSVTTIGNSAFKYCTSLTDVYYNGTQEQWNNISIGSGNDNLTSANIHYNSNGVQFASLDGIEMLIEDTNSSSAFTYSGCVAGKDYIIINISNFSDDFELNSDNLLYIDQLTADENGEIITEIQPRYSDPDSVTVLIGDFGNGIEQRIVTNKDIRGYVSDDNSINSSDALLVLQAATGNIQLTAIQKIAADVNVDSKINSQDALMILQYSTGLINKFN